MRLVENSKTIDSVAVDVSVKQSNGLGIVNAY